MKLDRVTDRYRRWVTRSTSLSALRAPLVDAVVFATAVALICAEFFISDRGGPPVLSVVLIVIASLPILIRRQRPALSLLLAMLSLGALLPLAHTYNVGPLPTVVCAYTLASLRGRRAAAVAGALTLPAVLLLLELYSPHNPLSWDTVKNLSLAAIPLVVGLGVYDRRAYTAALIERAEFAERTREEESRRRVGEERLHIAREIHDLVAHALVAINVQAGVSAHLISRDPDRAGTTLRDIKKVSGQALIDLRSVLGVLRAGDETDTRAPVQPALGLAWLDDLREDLASAGIALTVQLGTTTVPLPASVDATAYRIIQEALTNVMRHVGPTTARVAISHVSDAVVIEVEDDGGTSSTPLEITGSGNGIRGMRERAAAIGGSVEVGPRVGSGWRVVASLPIETV